MSQSRKFDTWNATAIVQILLADTVTTSDEKEEETNDENAEIENQEETETIIDSGEKNEDDENDVNDDNHQHGDKNVYILMDM